MIKIECSKCEGKGILAHYMAYANGQCFQCKGKGYKMLTERQAAAAEREAKRMEANERAEWEVEAEAEANTRLKPGNIITHKHPKITDRYKVKRIENGRIVCKNLQNGKETLIGILAEEDYKVIG
jgi:DnaJ-class molecular chaperone